MKKQLIDALSVAVVMAAAPQPATAQADARHLTAKPCVEANVFPIEANRTASDAMVPQIRPRLTRSAAEQLLREGGVTDGFGVLGVRGYYLNSMGKWGMNDNGVYDDAIVIVTPKHCETFNGNTDPTVHKHEMATLEPGTYSYEVGIHGKNKPNPRDRYKALIQAGVVAVRRDDTGDYPLGPRKDLGVHQGGGRWIGASFGINIHRGSIKKTSSLGCQTIVPAQWASFFRTVTQQMELFQRKRIPYVLRVGQGVEDYEVRPLPETR